MFFRSRLPVIKDAQKKTLILILAFLLGGLVGAGIVLGNNVMRKMKETKRIA